MFIHRRPSGILTAVIFVSIREFFVDRLFTAGSLCGSRSGLGNSISQDVVKQRAKQMATLHHV